MSSDPFSDVLRLADAKSVVSGGFAAGGTWALRFPPPERIKIFVVTKGSCWLLADGEKKAVTLEQGDVFLVSGREGFLLASSLTATPRDARRAFGGTTFAQLGDGSDCTMTGLHVTLHPSSGPLFVDLLPTLIHVRATSPQAATLRWIMSELLHEHGSNLPGASVVSAQLAQLVFVQVLRAYLSSSRTLPVGWLRVISDERLSPALRLMHGDPGRAWGLDELAKAAAMSRTTFAVYFKSVAGLAPLAYLTEWRMRLAQRILRDEDRSVAELAESLGYGSESAFSHAFKRITGSAPRNYRNAARQLPTPSEGARDLEAGSRARAAASAAARGIA